MTVYQPATEIIESYTDEHLRTRTAFAPIEAAKLLSIPAEYRQPAEVEVTRRSTRTTYVKSSTGLDMEQKESIADACEVRTHVVAEIRAQLAR